MQILQEIVQLGTVAFRDVNFTVALSQPDTLLAIIVAAIAAYVFHEFGHVIALRHYGIDGRVRVFQWRDAEFRAQHGRLAYLNVLSVNAPNLPSLSNEALRVCFAAGTAMEGVFCVVVATICIVASVFLDPQRAGFVLTVVPVWISLQIGASLLLNVIPNPFAMNDGFAMLFPGKWRAAAIERDRKFQEQHCLQRKREIR